MNQRHDFQDFTGLLRCYYFDRITGFTGFFWMAATRQDEATDFADFADWNGVSQTREQGSGCQFGTGQRRPFVARALSGALSKAKD